MHVVAPMAIALLLMRVLLIYDLACNALKPRTECQQASTVWKKIAYNGANWSKWVYSG